MTLAEALAAGLLTHHTEEGRTELRTPDLAFKVWPDPAPCRPCSWRWARVEPVENGENYGGAPGLKSALWQIVFADRIKEKRR